jgi:hypothetical protein
VARHLWIAAELELKRRFAATGSSGSTTWCVGHRRGYIACMLQRWQTLPARTLLIATSLSRTNYISYLAYCECFLALSILSFMTFMLCCCLSCRSKASYFLAHQHYLMCYPLRALLELSTALTIEAGEEFLCLWI